MTDDPDAATRREALFQLRFGDDGPIMSGRPFTDEEQELVGSASGADLQAVADLLRFNTEETPMQTETGSLPISWIEDPTGVTHDWSENPQADTTLCGVTFDIETWRMCSATVFELSCPTCRSLMPPTGPRAVDN